MRPGFLLVVELLSVLSASTINVADAKKVTFGSGGKDRTYYLYVPDTVKPRH